MTTNYPAGVSAMVHTVNAALRAKGVSKVHVEPFARGVLVTVRPADLHGSRKINLAHAALRAADGIAPNRLHRQAPNVLRVIVRQSKPRKRAAKKATPSA